MSKLVLGNKEYSNIQNVIFDLGGVIMNIDFQKAINSLKEIGFTNFDKLYNQMGQSGLFDSYDKGLVTPAEFRDGLRKVSGIKVTDKAFNKAWNSMLVDIPEDRIRLLKTLKKHFRTYLLSNTNEIHLERLYEYISQTHNLKNFDPLFDNVYYSCRVHMRKPDAEIYLYVLNKENLKAEETLFIDDFQPNIDAAVALGINGYCLTVENLITTLFAGYL